MAGRTGFDSQERQIFSSSLCIQTSSEADLWVPGSFPGGKVRPGSGADHLPTSSACVKNRLCRSNILSTLGLAWRVARQLYFTLNHITGHFGGSVINTFIVRCDGSSKNTCDVTFVGVNV
jgi:hypothetical protein